MQNKNFYLATVPWLLTKRPLKAHVKVGLLTVKGISTERNSDNKVFSLGSPAFKDFYMTTLNWVIPLCIGHIKHWKWRYNLGSGFFKYLLKYKKTHGVNLLVAQLKAWHIALMRATAGQPFRSLREIEPDLPLTGLKSGLPKIIDPHSRYLIRKGDHSTIRLWLTFFNIYRVIKCDFKPKLQTITEDFKGDQEGLAVIETAAQLWTPFNKFKVRSGVKTEDLCPGRPRIISSASPSQSVSWMGLFTDAYWLSKYHKVTYKHFIDYLKTLGNSCQNYKDMKPNGLYDLQNFMKYFNYSVKLYEEIHGLIGRVWSKWENYYFFPSDKKKINGIYVHGIISESGEISLGDRYTHDVSRPIGQIAVKEEAAGKLRLFALCDSWTQSLLHPLHSYLFKIIRQIPNDGTFDQEASVRRSMVKAAKASKVYSFDLSAATDRLPISLQSHVLDTITGIKGLGLSWANLLTSREYFIPLKSRVKYGIDNLSVTYAVGQPMGAYSSWAMLDITHHWILQYCASRVYNISLFSPNDWVWNEEYEILGDDIDIFNEKLAEEYLKVMSVLGVDINLGKSLISDNGSFEFAKRYINRGTDVSGLSWRQFVDYPKYSGAFIGSILQWLDRGLIQNYGVFVNMLNRSIKKRDLGNVKALRHMYMPLITILGIYTSKGRMPLSWLAETLVNPNRKGLNLDLETLIKEGLPYQRVFKYIKEINNKINKMEKVPETLMLMELDPHSTFLKGKYPMLEENVKIVNSLAFIPKRKRAIREWWSRLIMPYWSYVAGEDLLRSSQASKEVIELMNTKSTWPDMKGWDDSDTLIRHYVTKALPHYTKYTVFKALESKFCFDPNVMKLIDDNQSFNSIGWKILDFYKSVVWNCPLENDLTPIPIALLRDKPLHIEEEVKEVCSSVPLSSPFYKGERSYSVRLDSEDFLSWTKDYIYEMDRVEVKTPLLDHIDVKLPDHKNPYAELRPRWLISLIKALKGLHLTHGDVSKLSSSSITFYKRPVNTTDLKGGVEDWIETKVSNFKKGR